MYLCKNTNKSLPSALCLLFISVLHDQFFAMCGAPVDKKTAHRLLDEAEEDTSGRIGVKFFKGLVTELVLFKATITKEAPTPRGSDFFSRRA